MAAEEVNATSFPKAKTILNLGCGMCVPALAKYLNDCGFYLIIATRTPSKADPVIAKCSKPDNIRVEQLDVTSKDFEVKLDKLTKQSRLVISMLPYLFHAKAAQICVNNKVDFCTTSYVQPGVQALDEKAKEAGIILLNECGVDPGMDHMSAAKIIDEAQAKGGKVKSFYSITGGLPAPQDNDNPFGYKFSWAPRGVLLASKNGAKYWKDSKTVIVQPGGIFEDEHVRTEDVAEIGKLEWYLNRDSQMYIDVYGLKEIETIVRGTYRYPGWCKTLKMIADLDLTSEEKMDLEGTTYKEYTMEMLKAKTGTPAEAIKAKMEAMGAKWDKAYDEAVSRLEWVGLFSDQKIASGITTSLDALCDIFKQKLVYKPGEKDMIMMKHTFVIEYKEGSKKVESVMCDFGLQSNKDTKWDDSYSSMCRTVGLPVSVAAKLIIDGTITTKGVVRPTKKDVYMPILKEMASLGVKFVDTETDL